MLKMFKISLRDKKINILNILLVSMMCIAITILLIYKGYYKYQIEVGPGTYESNRKYNLDIHDISKVDSFIDLNKIDDITENYKNIEGLYKGKTIYIDYDENLNENEAYISSSVYSKIIAPNNKKISITIDNENYDLKIIDEIKDNNVHIYISKILFMSLPKLSIDYYTITFNNYLDLKEFDKEINKLGYRGNLKDNTQYEEIYILEKSNQTLKLLIYIEIFIIFIILNILVNNIFLNEERNMALLKVIGYKNQSILLYFILKLFTIFITSLLFTNFLFISIKIIFQYNNDTIFGNYIKTINILNISLVPSIIFLIILILKVILSFNKIKKMNIFGIL